ncbi:MAG: hypothetical protein ACTHNH_20955 [Mesorhizobium sp.]
MPLIRLDDGDYLNTNSIVKFRRLRNNHFKFLDVNGGEHTGSTHPEDEPHDAFFQVIPAAAGYTAIFDEGGGTRYYRPVVGWRVCPGGNFALTEGSQDPEYGYVAIIAPDGSVFDIEGARFESLKEWGEAFEEEQQLATERAAA